MASLVRTTNETTQTHRSDKLAPPRKSRTSLPLPCQPDTPDRPHEPHRPSPPPDTWAKQHKPCESFLLTPEEYSPRLCISMHFAWAPHIRRTASSMKSTAPQNNPTACSKAHEMPVKPQNVVGLFCGPQCLFSRQSARRSLNIGHCSIQRALVHRVIHRSWGTAY